MTSLKINVATKPKSKNTVNHHNHYKNVLHNITGPTHHTSAAAANHTPFIILGQPITTQFQ